MYNNNFYGGNGIVGAQVCLSVVIYICNETTVHIYVMCKTLLNVYTINTA